MEEEKKPIKDDTGGIESMVPAVKILLNQYPGLLPGEEVKFEELEETSGIAFINNGGAMVYDEDTDVTGSVDQKCQYLFILIYRMQSSRERQKLIAQQFLDTFGKWLCREPNVYERGGAPVEYPVLTDGRKIIRLKRDLISATDPTDKGVQDWMLPVAVEYMNRFEEPF